MARLQARFAAVGVILALMLVMAPLVGRAQSNGELFAEAVASQVDATPLAGPNELDLAQTPGLLTVYKAGLDVGDFVAHATFVNPEIVDGVGWDYGFQFRTSGNNEDFRVYVMSDGTWNFGVGTAAPSQSAIAPAFDVTPGAVNELDLLVEGTQGLFGVNGQLAGSILLPEQPATGDVYASTGFLGQNVVEDRIVSLTDFSVFPLPGAAAPEGESESVVEQSALPARPVTLMTGTCDDPGEVVLDLLEATYPVGERVGAASALVAETSFTRVPFLLGDLLAEPYAINIAESFDAPDVSIACSELGGIPDELGGFVIGLTPRGDSGYAGTIFMAADDINGATNVSVFLSPIGVASAEPVADEAATAAEDSATPEASPVADADIEAIVEDAATEGTVIEIETAAQATPAA